ncbi:MAG: 1-deoxy-D-xylulose-5-phosphate reductoisomerase [Acidimicrobiia bacterium]
MRQPVVVLGATGSIGRQTLDVATRLGLSIAGLAAGRPSAEFVALAHGYPDAALAVAGGSRAEREEFSAAAGRRRIEYGTEAVVDLAATGGVVVVNGIVGLAGLGPTLAAVTAGNRLALANKESLVAAGDLVMTAVRTSGAELIPVDSEHSAIFQCLIGEPADQLARIWLTASGGPFREWPMEDLENVTPEQALRHPNWEMGRRITVDSATLVNKGLEVIETHRLFGLDYDMIEVLIHPQSVIHSMVEFSDSSVKAQLGPPDMRLPIEYALTYPGRGPRIVDDFQWAGLALNFEEPDLKRFPCLGLGYDAGRAGGSAPAVFNAADEIAVEAFLQGRLGFTGISRVVASTLEAVAWRELAEVEAVMEVDREARQTAASLIAGVC